jgi:hypothetical protein
MSLMANVATLELQWMRRQRIASTVCERVSFTSDFDRSQKNLGLTSQLILLVAGRDSNKIARILTISVQSRVPRVLLRKREPIASFAQGWTITAVCSFYRL